MDFNGQSVPHRVSLPVDLAWGFGLVILFSLAAGWVAHPPFAFYLLAAALYLGIGGLVFRAWPEHRDFGPANRTTLLRGTLVIVLTALAPFAGNLTDSLWLYAWMCLLALILDGVDGKVARVTRSGSHFGARFDMELDALFILGLSVAVLAIGKAGPWVLGLGLTRYAFVISSCFMNWLNAPLPDSFRRKTVCVWQIVTLMVAILPPINPLFASATLATALALLVWSFFLDIRWLYERRHPHDVQ
ncbi:CDP-alcohol phosphatidyltransferase family protein [Marinobacter sp. F3R08]|uniref:CDP-alcohol phosphatidyltransferase family protein n=1 Tax=Marinobacter sp. F3R08 TaxID=2841559 RepID=UPI001C086092|nr:CDP-alcohol phosphatidyltransferase family protein [Marinobacter sp. F3R08]MBU2955573.1 CDP-alcohol phosphatidyltransferase family protein [Marinobacter sp. F3R08]